MLWALVCTAAEIAPFYIEIEAPPDLKTLLETELDVVRWSKRTEITPRQMELLFEAAPEQARALAETAGFFEAQVKSQRLERAGKPLLRLEVVPGQPVRVAKVDVRVEGPVTTEPDGAKRIDRAQRAFRLQPGEVFTQDGWTAAKERVVRSLKRKRYATAHITQSRAEIDPAARTAVLSLVVDSGPTITLGPPRISGLQRYSPRLVQNLNPIRPGSVYDEEELLKYQRRLLSSGHFASALVAANPDPHKPDDTPVQVTVVESPAQRVEFGVGYSTDVYERLQLGYTHDNAFDQGLRFSSHLELDRLVQEARAGFAFPRQEDGWRYLAGGNVKKENIQDQRIFNWSVTGEHLFAIEEYESALSLQYLSEKSELHDGPTDYRDALFLNQRWLWNTLDDPINPRKGTTFQIQTGGAAEPVASTKTFGRVHLRANHLQRLNPRLTLLLRGEAGAVLADSRNGIPSDYVFRTGGDTSIRGYAFESLGVDQDGAVVGGRYLTVASAELMPWFNDQWGLAAFIDWGNAWDDLDAFNPTYGVGGGVRWRSPLGNLHLDLAWPEGKGKGRIHFSVGIVFR
jgi:translocation and assembly module TamA